jgi:hypothetical protein
MPTYTPTESFLRDFRGLSVEQQEAFRKALGHFIENIKGGRFRAGLRVKGIQGMPGCFEMSWAADGRAIFTYGAEVREGERHVMWLAIGTHAILP